VICSLAFGITLWILQRDCGYPEIKMQYGSTIQYISNEIKRNNSQSKSKDTFQSHNCSIWSLHD